MNNTVIRLILWIGTVVVVAAQSPKALADPGPQRFH